MKRVLSLLLSLVMLVSFISIPTFATSDSKNLTVLFTHDLHSHIEPSKSVVGGKKVETGGFAKIKTMIDNVKAQGNNTLLVDGGDFSMGTLFQTVFADEAIELRMLGALGYDATTLGNHEFDYDSGNLAKMLTNAKDKSSDLPMLLSSNINWEKSKSKDKQALKTAFEYYGVEEEYTVVQKGNVKIAMFGLMGWNSAEVSPNSGLTFDDISASAKKTVAKIKANEDVDMIVCLSHSGTSSQKMLSEDETLAKNVPEIDVIISGHTHSITQKPIKSGNTIIVSCGEYGVNLGRIDMTKNAKGRWDVNNFVLMPVDQTVPSDPATQKQINELKKHIKSYLEVYGYKDYSQIIGYTPYNFADVYTINSSLNDQDLTRLITDSYVYAVQQAEGDKYKPIDVALVPAGAIRSTFINGSITVADVFEVCSLGIGSDGLAGYPLISIYLTGEEIKLIAEIDVSVGDMVEGVQFFTTGLKYTYNPNRARLNRITKISLQKPDGQEEEIINDKLYRVVMETFTVQMLKETVQDKSFGVLAINPKDEQGNEITDLSTAIIYDKQKATVSKWYAFAMRFGLVKGKEEQKIELKQWYALAKYIESFDKSGGVPTIPQMYEDATPNKTIHNSYWPSDLFGSFSDICKTISTYSSLVVAAVKHYAKVLFPF